MNEGQNGNGGGAGGGFASSGGGSDGFDALMNGGGNSGATVGGGVVSGVGGVNGAMAANGGDTVANRSSVPAEQLVVNGVPISGVVNAPKASSATPIEMNGGGAVSGFGVAPSMGITNGTPMNYVGPAGSGTGANVSAGGGMGYVGPAMSVSSGTGDITLSSGEEKKSKKGWIIGILVGVVVIGIVVAVVGMTMSGGSIFAGGNIKKDWEEYYNYLMYGPEGGQGEVTIDTWYPERVVDDDPGEVEIGDFVRAYYDELEKKFETFYKDGKKEIKGIDEYAEIVRGFVDYNTMSGVQEKLHEIYKSDGERAASEYIDNFGLDGDSVAFLYAYMKRYLRVELAAYKLYEASGCYADGVLNEECADGVTNDDAEAIRNSEARDYEVLESYYVEVFTNKMYTETRLINNEVEAMK